MFRIDTPHATTTPPTYSNWDGVARYFTDADPFSTTELSAEWFNHVQEELCYLIEHQGYRLSKQDTTLLYKAVTAPIKSHASDTGVVSADHSAAVIVSKNSRASNTNTAVLASTGSIVDEPHSMLVCSKNAELAESGVLALGYSSTPIEQTQNNQNLTIKFYAATGDIHTSGNVNVQKNVLIEGNLQIYGKIYGGANVAQRTDTYDISVAPGGIANVAVPANYYYSAIVITMEFVEYTEGVPNNLIMTGFMAGSNGYITIFLKNVSSTENFEGTVRFHIIQMGAM